ncbi:DNA-binding SARP family transcriptional activator [Catenulispora sp. EB89]|uniref:BTAD domain-containing putative transcriptional regulator n=1 Tax=Catenulispora sp. EB89 TaxID=3156257 RepID=UPI0035149253
MSTGASAVGPSHPVRIRALGPIEATVADRPVDLGAPKQRALAALLVSRVGQPVAVDLILDTLWADHPPASPMASLQAYVANLRRLLEPDRPPRAPATVLRTSPRGYLLDGGVVDVDVSRFTEHATAGWQAWDRDDPRRALREFEAALALWRGQAYEDVAGALGVAPDVARLEELQLAVFEMRCAALLAVGAHARAVAELGAFMKAHPLREYGCELLSRALYRSGRQAEALDVLRAIEVQLTEELGLDPSPNLQQLKVEILNQAPTLDRRPTAAEPIPSTSTALLTPSPPPSLVPSAQTLTTQPPAIPDPAETVPERPFAEHPPQPTPETDPDGDVFVGREPLLAQLTEALAAARAGRGRVAAVSGEPAVGKTRLLNRFADLADLAGVPVLWGTCPEHVTAPPLWPWEQVLRATADALPQRPVPALVGELIDGPDQSDGVEVAATATLRSFEAIVHYLTGATRTEPLVVVLDNLHRADACSLRLLAHLAESVAASRLLLVVSYRSDEAPVLAETLAALARRETTRIAVAGLTARDAQRMAGAILRRGISERAAEVLCARTDGNPFFLREFIKALTTEHALEDPGAVPVPTSVREVVLRRVAQLPHPVGEALSVAAVVGRHFEIEVVAGVLGIEIDAALELLDAAVAAGVVVEDRTRLGWFRFAHALVAEVLCETTGHLRRARLHRRIGAMADHLPAPNLPAPDPPTPNPPTPNPPALNPSAPNPPTVRWPHPRVHPSEPLHPVAQLPQDPAAAPNPGCRPRRAAAITAIARAR